MKRESLICGIAIIAFVGLSSGALCSNYKKAQEEAKSRNVAVSKNDSAAEIYLNGPPPDWTEEVLMGSFANRDELSIRVATGGCTKKADFWIWCHYDEESKGGPPHYVLTIYRTRKDECKAFHPSGVLIKFNLRENLGLPDLFRYSITNKVEVGISPNK